MPPHPLTNFEIQKYHQNEPKFSGVYSRNNLPKIQDGAYVINFDEFKSIGTHWIASYVNVENLTYFDNFGVKYISKEIRKFIRNKNITKYIYSIKAFYSVMCGYVCIGFIDFMLKCNSLLDYTNFFSPNDYEQNDTIIF